MKNINYNNQIKIICIIMAVVLCLGVFFSVWGVTEKEKQVKLPTEKSGNITEFKSIINTKAPEDYDGILDIIVRLRSEYSNTLKLFTLGYTARNRAIPLLTMGSGEKKALIVSAIHAREHLTTKYILRCIEDYCYAVEKGSGMYGEYDIKKLLSQYTLYIVPCVNPDGLEIVLNHQKLKNGVSVNLLEDYKANYNGVDLNRNFPLAWERVNNGVTKPAGYYFKGYNSGSENETKALMKLCEENAFSFLLSVHIKGNCIYWGDMYNTSYNSIYKAFATDIGSVAGLYITEPTKKAKDYGGGFENWFRHTYTKPGLCIELVDNENIINPCTRENYRDFDKIVNYEKTRFIMAEAMDSENK